MTDVGLEGSPSGWRATGPSLTIDASLENSLFDWLFAGPSLTLDCGERVR